MTFRLRGDSRRLTAAEINRWNRVADQQARGELRKILPPRVDSYDPSSRVALCKNTSGADRARFDCMAVDGLVWDLETDGTSDVVFELITADPDKAPAILIEPIADGAVGRAVLDGLAIAKVGGGSGMTGVPNAANHRIAPGGGSIKLLAAPHATDVTLLPVVLNVGGEASGHFLFTLTGTISAGAGAATIRNMADDAEIETGASVKDPLGYFDGLTSGNRGVCVKADGEYYALGPYVTGVTWSSPNLSYETGSDSTPIDTATACP